MALWTGTPRFQRQRAPWPVPWGPLGPQLLCNWSDTMFMTHTNWFRLSTFHSETTDKRFRLSTFRLRFSDFTDAQVGIPCNQYSQEHVQHYWEPAAQGFTAQWPGKSLQLSWCVCVTVQLWRAEFWQWFSLCSSLWVHAYFQQSILGH